MTKLPEGTILTTDVTHKSIAVHLRYDGSHPTLSGAAIYGMEMNTLGGFERPIDLMLRFAEFLAQVVVTTVIEDPVESYLYKCEHMSISETFPDNIPDYEMMMLTYEDQIQRGESPDAF